LAIMLLLGGQVGVWPAPIKLTDYHPVRHAGRVAATELDSGTAPQ
jgi:hypothetical protein